MKKILIGIAVGVAVGCIACKKSTEIHSLIEKGKKKLQSMKD